MTSVADLTRLDDLAEHPSVESALSAVREILDVEVAFLSTITETEQIVDAVGADEPGLLVPGARVPLELTLCWRVLQGELPHAIGDVRAHPVASAVPVAQLLGVGAYATVPLRLSDGRLHGTLCCGSPDPRPDLGDRELRFMRIIGRLVADHIEREALQRLHERERLESASVSALLAAVAARDGYTGEHSEAVVEHAVAVARALELDEQTLSDVAHVALLHDVGKLGTPDSILHKPGKLDDDEWRVMREHPAVGGEIVARLPGLERLAPAVRAEHERWDGSGYPDGLAGERIPIASRIALVCDAYHAMTSDRPYRRSLGHATAIEELRRHAGSQFCPRSVEALLRVLDAGALSRAA